MCRILLSACLLSGFLACTSTKTSLREHKGSYLESVKLNFEAGEIALKKNEFDKAVAYFQFVKSKYPFSKYAALSDLRIADAKYMQKKWLDAAASYEVFIRLHPRHEEVAYASYRLGASYFFAIPSDFFLYPSSTSRDQSATKEALAAIERFVVQFPDSAYREDAQQKLALLYSKLAQHNLHIAHYYQRRGRYEAAISRYLSVHELYPSTPESAESLYKAAQIAKDKLKDIDRAQGYLLELIETKPPSVYKTKAEEELKNMVTE